jgi:SPP1 gp7 family putative phage head morphogenesis protein
MRLSDYAKFEGTVRASINQNLTTDQTINELIGKYYKTTDKYFGTIQGTRYSAERLTRTVTNGISNGAQQEFFKANADIIAYEVYMAILDGRTSVICGSLDGNRYKVGAGPVPPLHINCRSTRAPVIDGIGLLGERPSIGGTNFREEARKTFIGKKMNRGLTKKQSQKAWNKTSNSYKNSLLNKERRAFGKNVIGGQPPDTTYSSWLKKQDASFQSDVLGKTNAAKFRSGEMTLAKFTDKLGKPLTLDELASKYPKVYK